MNPFDDHWYTEDGIGPGSLQFLEGVPYTLMVDVRVSSYSHLQSGTATVFVDHSDDGETWEQAIATEAFEPADVGLVSRQGISPPKAFVRLRWEITGGRWKIGARLRTPRPMDDVFFKDIEAFPIAAAEET